MSQVATLNGQQIYEKKKIRLVFWGMFLAIMSGVTALIQSIFNDVIGQISMANSGVVLPDNPFATLVLVVTGLAIADFIGSGWTILFNIVTGRSVKEYVRTIKLPVSWMMAISAITAGALGQALAFTAYDFCGMTVAATIVGATPLITVIIARFVFKEKLSPRALMGVVIIVIGGSLAAWGPTDISPNFYVGILFALIAAVGFSLEGIASTYAADMIDPYIGCGFFRCFIAGVGELTLGAIVVVAIGFQDGLAAMFTNIFTAEVLPLFLCMGFLSAVSYGTIYGAFPKSGPSRTLALVFTNPLWTIPVGYIAAAIIPQYYEFGVNTMVVLGAVAVVVGGILVVIRPSELINLRDV